MGLVFDRVANRFPQREQSEGNTRVIRKEGNTKREEIISPLPPRLASHSFQNRRYIFGLLRCREQRARSARHETCAFPHRACLALVAR